MEISSHHVRGLELQGTKSKGIQNKRAYLSQATELLTQASSTREVTGASKKAIGNAFSKLTGSEFKKIVGARDAIAKEIETKSNKPKFWEIFKKSRHQAVKNHLEKIDTAIAQILKDGRALEPGTRLDKREYPKLLTHSVIIGNNGVGFELRGKISREEQRELGLSRDVFTNDSKPTSAVLGKGSFGTVRLAQRGDKFYAVKKIDLYVGRDRVRFDPKTVAQRKANFDAEVKMLTDERLKDSAHVTNAVDSFVNHETGKGYIFMELLSGGDGNAVLDDFRSDIPPEVLKAVANGLLSGLQELHDQGIAHMDVKPDNILSNKDYTAFRVSDLGLSMPTGPSLSTRGTPIYLAPELLRAELEKVAYDPTKADIYSAGASLFKMISGQNLFDCISGFRQNFSPDQTRNIQLDQIREAKDSARMSNDTARIQLLDIVEKMTHVDPNQRLGLVEAGRLVSQV